MTPIVNLTRRASTKPAACFCGFRETFDTPCHIGLKKKEKRKKTRTTNNLLRDEINYIICNLLTSNEICRWKVILINHINWKVQMLQAFSFFNLP